MKKIWNYGHRPRYACRNDWALLWLMPGSMQLLRPRVLLVLTSIQAQGNFDSMTDLDWVQTSADPITEALHSTRESTTPRPYKEDTQLNGVGNIYYDKTTLVETKARLTNQWNVEAEKQINFVGIDGARVSSDESIFLDGTGRAQNTTEKMICVFAPTVSKLYPGIL